MYGCFNRTSFERGAVFWCTFLFAPPELHETGTIRKHWNRATIYVETKRVHEQLSEIRALECGLKNVVNAMLCAYGNCANSKHIIVLPTHTVGLSLDNVSDKETRV